MISDESAHGSTLDSSTLISQDALTIESWQANCGNLGYGLAGLESGKSCYCGNTIFNEAFPVDSLKFCSNPCNGDSLEMCGGSSQISIYMNPSSVNDTGVEVTFNASSVVTSVQKNRK